MSMSMSCPASFLSGRMALILASRSRGLSVAKLVCLRKQTNYATGKTVSFFPSFFFSISFGSL